MELTPRPDGRWGAELRLASWAGFQSRLGAYGRQESGGASDGAVDLTLLRREGASGPLTPQEAALAPWFAEREPGISAAVKTAIVEALNGLGSDIYSGWDLPAVRGEEDLKGHVGLTRLYLFRAGPDHRPHLGYQLGCSWDEEHGLGVLARGLEVVDIGYAYTAFLLGMQEDEAG
jgi:hypothetical protein